MARLEALKEASDDFIATERNLRVTKHAFVNFKNLAGHAKIVLRSLSADNIDEEPPTKRTRFDSDESSEFAGAVVRVTRSAAATEAALAAASRGLLSSSSSMRSISPSMRLARLPEDMRVVLEQRNLLNVEATLGDDPERMSALLERLAFSSAPRGDAPFEFYLGVSLHNFFVYKHGELSCPVELTDPTRVGPGVDAVFWRVSGA